MLSLSSTRPTPRRRARAARAEAGAARYRGVTPTPPSAGRHGPLPPPGTGTGPRWEQTGAGWVGRLAASCGPPPGPHNAARRHALASPVGRGTVAFAVVAAAAPARLEEQAPSRKVDEGTGGTSRRLPARRWRRAGSPGGDADGEGGRDHAHGGGRRTEAPVPGRAASFCRRDRPTSAGRHRGAFCCPETERCGGTARTRGTRGRLPHGTAKRGRVTT